MAIYESEFCTVDTYAPDGKTTYWYIGDVYDGYGSPNWPSKEAMIADLEAAIAALRVA